MPCPLISVVTTVKDCDQFLVESLNSILNQTFRDFEVILIDDGSVDGTAGICHHYMKSDSRVRFYHNEVNKRIPHRRNEAIKLSRGKYIAIHDGDDVSLPIRLHMQASFLEAHPDVFCVGGHAIKIDEHGNYLSRMDYPPESHEDIVRTLLEPRKNPMIDPTVMYRRDKIIQLGGYTTEQKIYTVPDLDLWCRAVVGGLRMSNIQSPVIHYRVNPNGMTVRHHKEMMRAHGTVYARFKNQMRSK